MAALNENLTARDILSYLLSHTSAEDTIEGIVEWWLPEERIRQQTNEVKKILDKLVADSLISTRMSEDSRTRYRLNKRKLKEIRELVDRRND